MPNDTPQTLPANFFDKKGGTPPPQTLPPEFFSKTETKEEGGVKTKPLDLGQATTISAQPSFWQRLKSSAVNEGPVGIGEEFGRSMRRPFEQSTIPVPGTGKTVGEATHAQGDWANLVFDTLGLTGGAGIGGPEALEAVGEATVGKLASKASPIQKINKILGVGMKEITPGKLPASLDEFAVNPARGVIKAGLDESKLAKMDPVERYNAMTKAKDAAGKELGQILDLAGKQGKTVDAYAPITKVFSKLDSAEIAKAEKLLQESMGKHGIDLGNLDKLTPSQAQALKQDLWDSGDVGKELYRGIAESIKKAVPEAKDAMRDYGDLLGAEKATRRGAQKFGSKAPESQLRKLFMKHIVPKSAEGAAITGGGIAAYELYKALFGGKGSTPVP